MATKEEALQYIKMLAEEKVLTKEEIENAYGLEKVDNHVSTKKNIIAEILYYVGGGIVFLGISILIGQNWSELGIVTKILATLGMGILTYIIGVLLVKKEKTQSLSQAFFLISALVLPIGLYVLFDNAGFQVNSYGAQTTISLILLVIYLISYLIFEKNIFAFFSVVFGTWLFFSFTSVLISDSYFYDLWKFYAYRIMIVAISYMSLGYAFSKNKLSGLSSFLYGFGILGFLGSALSLGGYKPDANLFWELIYPVLVFGTIFLSVQVKSKAFLTWGSVFLIIYIGKITSEYFYESIGWPLALVLVGLVVIGIGYGSISIKRKYIS